MTRRYGNLIDAFLVISENLKRIVVEYEIPRPAGSRRSILYGMTATHWLA